MTPRVLFVGRTRYRLPLDPGLARKWDALSEQMDVRVIASGTGRDPRFHLVPRRPLDGPSFYTALPWVVAGELRSFRPDVVIAESVFEAAAVEVAVRVARSRALVVAEVHGDWRVWASHYGSRVRGVLGAGEQRRRGPRRRPRRRAPCGLGVYGVDARIARRHSARGLHDVLRPDGLRRPHGACPGGAARALRRGARALQERRGSRCRVAARLRFGARCRASSRRAGNADRGRRGARARGRALGASGSSRPSSRWPSTRRARSCFRRPPRGCRGSRSSPSPAAAP